MRFSYFILIIVSLILILNYGCSKDNSSEDETYIKFTFKGTEYNIRGQIEYGIKPSDSVGGWDRVRKSPIQHTNFSDFGKNMASILLTIPIYPKTFDTLENKKYFLDLAGSYDNNHGHNMFGLELYLVINSEWYAFIQENDTSKYYNLVKTISSESGFGDDKRYTIEGEFKCRMLDQHNFPTFDTIYISDGKYKVNIFIL
jgi:hypothetical protein